MNKNMLKLFIAIAIFGWVFLACSALTFAKTKTIKWKMGSCHSAGNPLIEADRHFVKVVNELSGGEFEIQLFSAGEIVPARGVFEAVKNGVLQAGGDWPGYWAGKDSAFNALTGFPMLPRQIDFITWIYEGGGIEMYNKIYGKYGMVYFPHFVESAESGIRSKKRYTCLADFKNSKIRMGGRLQTGVLKEIGAIPVSIIGEETYQALQSGMIDGAEYNLPYMDWAFGFQYITTEQSAPAWQQPANVLGVMISKKAWNELPKKYQSIIKYAAQATVAWGIAHASWKSGIAQGKFLEKGTRVTYLDDSALDKIEEISRKNILEEAKKNPLFAEAAYSFFKTIQTIAPYRDLERPLLKREVRFSSSYLNELKKFSELSSK